jgi:hypothetical protein
MISDCVAALSQNYSGDNSHEKKADDLDRHVTGGVSTWEAVPVPVRNVRRYRGQDSSDKHEADSAGNATDARLCQKEHHQD